MQEASLYKRNTDEPSATSVMIGFSAKADQLYATAEHRTFPCVCVCVHVSCHKLQYSRFQVGIFPNV